jgi:Arc/MetJ-type ribon-helix-helix transcriptional regulator
VLDAWERLAQELGRLPTREEVVRRAVPQLIEQERWADHRDRAERAAREVLEALDRKRLPLANDREDEEGEERKPGITPPSPGPGPEEVVINSEQIQAWCQQACKILGPEQGQKWVVAFVLHERKLERTPWEEIAGWLREPDSLVHKFWGTVWEAYGLNGCVPGSWREIQELFAVPPPILSDDLTKSSANLRQWYSRANGELERHGSPRARPPAG